MFTRDLGLQIATIVSVIIAVNGFPQRDIKIKDNSLDATFSDQGSGFSIKQIMQLIAKQHPKLFQVNSDENKIEDDPQVALAQRPKPRTKRFACWHSCLGPWQQKNPRLQELRHRISNVSPGNKKSGHSSPEPVESNDIKPNESGESGNKESGGKAEGGEADGGGGEGAKETPDAEAAADEAANNEAAATESTEGEATEAPTDGENPEGEETAKETEGEEAIEAPAGGEEAATEAPAEEASGDEVPAPENEEDGKEEKNEEKRQIGSNEDAYYEEEFSAEGLSGGNVIDEENYMDAAAAA